MEEIWRPIAGFEGLYEVSSTGQVRNHRGKLLRPGPDHNGYLKCVLCKKGKRKTIYIHRLVAEAFIPNPMCLKQVNHMDEDKSNNNVENLEWCDAKYNVNYGSAQEKRVKTNVINGRFKYTGHRPGKYHKEYDDEYRNRNREKLNERAREYYRRNREKRLEYYKENKEKKLEYYKENKEKRLEYQRKYYWRNKEKVSEYHKLWYQKKKGK